MKIAITCIQLIRDISKYLPYFEKAGVEVVVPEIRGQHLEGEALVSALEDCVGVVAGDDQFTEEVLALCPQLKVISKWGIGVDGINKESAEKRGISITNTPGAFDHEVADVAMAYCTMLLRKLHRVDQGVRSGDWPKPAGRSLAGKTIGIVGLGGIGRAIALRSLAASMDVVGTDPSIESQIAATELGVRVVGFEELMGVSEIVSLSCPLNSSTYHLINESSLSFMKPGGWLINVSRGPVVDTEALLKALREGFFEGVALDVFEEEPPAENNEIRHFENVIFGSHNASNTLEASARVHARAIENLANGLGIEILI